MPSSLRRTGANVVWKALPAPFERLSRFVVLLVAAPTLGTARFGVYQFGLTTAALLLSITELGVGTWTTRALARDPRDAPVILLSGVRARLWGAIPYAGFLLAMCLLEPSGETRTTLVLIGGASLAGSLVDHAGAVLRGYEDFRREAVASIGRALLTTGGALGALLAFHTLMSLCVGLLVGAVASALVGAYVTTERLPGRDAWAGAKPLSLGAMSLVPLWLSGVFSVLYFRCDIVLLHALASDEDVGCYAAAYRVFEATTLLPSAVTAVMFPELARRGEGGARLGSLETRVALSLGSLGVATAAVLYAASTGIVSLGFGADFAPAVPSLRVLALAAPPLFLNYGLASFLFARGLERRYVSLAAGLFLVNVGVNLVVIPRWGGPGAAATTALCEVVLAAGCFLAGRAT